MRGFDLTGRRFGRLVVLRLVGRTKARALLWECRCDCGASSVVRAGGLLNGGTQSCGCLQREKSAAAKLTHGLARTPEYKVWDHMRQRCENPKHKGFANYGARGIRVCERWRKFENFIADMGERPSPKHTIERADNDGDYEPGNCRWGTWREQSRNKRTNRLITANGITKPLTTWAEELGVPPTTLFERLRRGWTHERVVNVATHLRHPSAKLTDAQAAQIKARYKPRKVSAAQLAEEFGVTKKTVLNIIHGRTFADVTPRR